MSRKVFISYSHDDDSHSRNVLQLSDQLNGLGLDCSIDQYESFPEEGWTRWMDTKIRNSDYVLVVCSENYCNRCYGRENDGIGKGGKFESHLIIDKFQQNDSKNRKFIPILINGEDKNNVPDFLKPFQTFRVQPNLTFEKDIGMQALYRHLTNQKKIMKPELGSLIEMKTGVNLPNNNRERVKSTSGLELTINKPFSQFSDDDQKRILGALAQILEMDESEIVVKKKYEGSTKLLLELPSDKSKLLTQYFKDGKFAHLDVIGVAEEYFLLEIEEAKMKVRSSRLDVKGYLRAGHVTVGDKVQIVELGGRVRPSEGIIGAVLSPTSGIEEVHVNADSFPRKVGPGWIMCNVGTAVESNKFSVSFENGITAGVRNTKNAVVVLGGKEMNAEVTFAGRIAGTPSDTCKISLKNSVNLVAGRSISFKSGNMIIGTGTINDIDKE